MIRANTNNISILSVSTRTYLQVILLWHRRSAASPLLCATTLKDCKRNCEDPHVMLCYGMLCYGMLCYGMLCYVMLCHIISYYVMLCYVMLYYVMLCYVMLWYGMLCYVMLCYVMLCYVYQVSVCRLLVRTLLQSITIFDSGFCCLHFTFCYIPYNIAQSRNAPHGIIISIENHNTQNCMLFHW